MSQGWTYGFCSWCFKNSRHWLKQGNLLRRNIYECKNCRERTLECRYCENMTHGGDWDDECCAVHNGSIADFKTLNNSLRNITEWRNITKRSGINAVKVGKVVGGIASVGLVATGAGVVAAPALGGALGSLGGVGGAAATSHGLAVLGGGALSAGGAGMAGGAVLVAVSAGALGGIGGGVLVNKYVGDIQGFDIVCRNKGKKSQADVIFVNGFLNQNESLVAEWKPTLKTHFPDSMWYEVNWESKRLQDLGLLATGIGSKQAFSKVAREAAKKASKRAAKKLSPLAIIGNLLDLGGNPFWVAMSKAQQTGYLLADLILRTSPEKRYFLLGHSMGARVIYYALQALAQSKIEEPRIVDAHLLGGAISSSKEDWDGFSSAVSGRINNYYSKKDDVLKILYNVGTLFGSDPIGRDPIQIKSQKVRNLNVTELVSGHMRYKENLKEYIET